MSKPCNKMGFTERASCRPYKNCYKRSTVKGGSKKKTASRKATGTVKVSRKHANKPSFVYHSEHTTFTSHPHKNTPYGKRTIVNITNGKGKKSLEILDKTGKTLKTSKKTLQMNEINELKSGNYIPGMWLGV
jgi:hypothetical protein